MMERLVASVKKDMWTIPNARSQVIMQQKPLIDIQCIVKNVLRPKIYENSFNELKMTKKRALKKIYLEGVCF